MLFDKFIRQYIEDLIECSDVEYELLEEDKEEIIDRIQHNERVWELLDSIICEYLEDFIKEVK